MDFATDLFGCFFDPNKDLWPDLVTAEDRFASTNQFYQNMGNAVLRDVSDSSQLDITVDAMGISIGDFNNDQYSDLLITNT